MYATDTDGRLLMPDLPDDRQATTALVARSPIALQHNAQRFRAIFDGVDESIALLKPNGHLIEVNLTAAKFLGIGAEARSRHDESLNQLDDTISRSNCQAIK